VRILSAARAGPSAIGLSRLIEIVRTGLRNGRRESSACRLGNAHSIAGWHAHESAVPTCNGLCLFRVPDVHRLKSHQMKVTTGKPRHC
jgi:hypothetical protein